MYVIVYIVFCVFVSGQQLVQMPDGKLHVLNTQTTTSAISPAQTATTQAVPGGRLALVTTTTQAASTPQHVTVVKATGQSGKQILRQVRPVTPLKTATVAGKPAQVINWFII